MKHREKKAGYEVMVGSAQGMPQPDGLRGRCGACSHIWVVAILPMHLASVAKLCASAVCPKCACAQVFVAQAAPEVNAQPVGEVKHG